MSFCSRCGKEIMDDKSRFCPGCGNELSSQSGENLSVEPATKMAPLKPPSIHDEKKEKTKAAIEGEISGKLKGTYFTSITSTIITFIIRLIAQETSYSVGYFASIPKTVGLNVEHKPFYTIIPIVATVIILLLIVGDKKAINKKNKLQLSLIYP